MNGVIGSLIPGQEEKILKKIGDKLYHLPDYRHELPDLIEHDILIDADEHTRICIKILNVIAYNAIRRY
jgi:hypothetical protein